MALLLDSTIKDQPKIRDIFLTDFCESLTMESFGNGYSFVKDLLFAARLKEQQDANTTMTFLLSQYFVGAFRGEKTYALVGQRLREIPNNLIDFMYEPTRLENPHTFLLKAREEVEGAYLHLTKNPYALILCVYWHDYLFAGGSTTSATSIVGWTDWLKTPENLTPPMLDDAIKFVTSRIDDIRKGYSPVVARVNDLDYQLGLIQVAEVSDPRNAKYCIEFMYSSVDIVNSIDQNLALIGEHLKDYLVNRDPKKLDQVKGLIDDNELLRHRFTMRFYSMRDYMLSSLPYFVKNSVAPDGNRNTFGLLSLEHDRHVQVSKYEKN